MSLTILVLSASIIESCSGIRSGSEPGGPITPGSGSATNVAAGRNTTSAPLSSSNGRGVSGTVGDNAAGSADSLSNQVDSVSKENKPMQFINEASILGISEVQLSEVAIKRSPNDYVKAFAAMMIKNHGEANAALQSLVVSKNISLDPQQNNDNTNINGKMSRLTTVTGEEFDNQYIQIMIADHEQAVSLFEDGSKSSDPEVKAYANKYLPMLKMHLKNISSLTSK